MEANTSWEDDDDEVQTLDIIQVSVDVAVIPAKAGIQRNHHRAKHTEYLA
jgi:hypothetical protein